VYLVLQKHDIFNLLFPLGLKELHPFAPWDDISTFSLVMAVTCISGGFLAQVTTAFLSEATNDLRRAASLKVISLYELIIVITSSIMIRRVILYGENVPVRNIIIHNNFSFLIQIMLLTKNNSFSTLAHYLLLKL
jgi:hypothetical protein